MTSEIQPEAFDYRHYLPILLTRQGERLALRETESGVKERMTPLFVVHPIDQDLETGQPKATVSAHLRRLAQQLAKDWGLRPAFVDVRYIPNEGQVHPLKIITQAAADHGLILAPVLNGSPDPALVQAATGSLTDHETVCLRLAPEQWAMLGSPTGKGALLNTVARVGVPPERIHLVIDTEAIVNSSPALVAAAVGAALTHMPDLEGWASVTVAGTAMPNGTGDVGRNQTADLPRTEWQAWRLVDAASKERGRRPTFGDYAVQHPDPLTGFDPRIMDSSAQLRYTISQAWFVARGQGLKKGGREQIRRLATQIVQHSEFPGPSFSWGDRWIADCANGRCSPGNQGVWRKATTNHHLHSVTAQLATLFGS